MPLSRTRRATYVPQTVVASDLESPKEPVEVTGHELLEESDGAKAPIPLWLAFNQSKPPLCPSGSSQATWRPRHARLGNRNHDGYVLQTQATR